MMTYRFAQIAQLITERVAPGNTTLDRYVGLEHLDPESLQIRRWGSPSDVIGEKLHFWPGDIIFGKRRAYQRKLAVADFEGICSAHAMVLRAKTDVILPEFLPFFMQSDLFMNRAQEISVGSLSPTINWRTLAEQEFPIPPLEEQRRIAGLLWAIDEMIESHKHLTTATENVVVSKRNKLIEHISSNTVPLYEFAQVIDCKHRTANFLESGIPVVSPGNINWGELNLFGCKKTSVEEYNDLMDHCTVEEWDLVLGRNQTFGIVSYVKNTKFAIGQDTVLIQTETANKKYLYLTFQSMFVQNQIAQMSMGSTFKRINLANIRKIRIPMPSNKDLENATHFVDEVEETKKQIRVKKVALNNLKYTLLRNIFV